MQRDKRKISSIKIRRFGADEATENSERSLERLVFRVFFYLLTLALGFALSWYVFPRVVVMPVLVDPRTGQLIDPQTGQVLADPTDAKGTGHALPTKPDRNNSGQSSSSNQSSKKGDNAQPK
jgi:hypothetical protein